MPKNLRIWYQLTALRVALVQVAQQLQVIIYVIIIFYHISPMHRPAVMEMPT